MRKRAKVEARRWQGRAERRDTQMARARAGADKAGNIMAGQGKRGKVV